MSGQRKAFSIVSFPEDMQAEFCLPVDVILERNLYIEQCVVTIGSIFHLPRYLPTIE